MELPVIGHEILGGKYIDNLLIFDKSVKEAL